MAWTTPKTWLNGETVTDTLLNTELRDYLNETAPAKVTAKGDLVAATGSKALARVAVGNTGTILRANTSPSTGVSWRQLQLLVTICTGISETSTSYVQQGGIFTYTAAQWGDAKVYFTATFKIQSGSNSVYAELWDLTASPNAQVSGSEISHNTSTFTQVTSGQLTLTDGHQYTVRTKVGAATTGLMPIAHLSFLNS